jgi:hypothetical protein
MSDFNETLISQHIFEKSLNIKFYPNCPVEAEFLHVDGQMDVMKLIVCLNFANACGNK